ncbi:MAG: hypothetical protein LBG13_03675 [Holosporales bacterium]|jgi:hypothetical protein|nr:hypothetical protein [Holosporales bacterium]
MDLGDLRKDYQLFNISDDLSQDQLEAERERLQKIIDNFNPRYSHLDRPIILETDKEKNNVLRDKQELLLAYDENKKIMGNWKTYMLD